MDIIKKLKELLPYNPKLKDKINKILSEKDPEIQLQDYNTLKKYFDVKEGYSDRERQYQINKRSEKMFKKKDLIPGVHWVETKNGELGCVMENGIVFRDGSHHINNYTDDLVNKYMSNATVIKILKPKFSDFVGKYDSKSEFDIIETLNSLKPITSLDQLEEVRKGLCEKYRSSHKFYITNEDGEYLIKGYVIYMPERSNHIKIDLEKEGYELKL